MKILQEEKAYWAAQCIEAREKAEEARSHADDMYKKFQDTNKQLLELEERFELLGKLTTIMQRTGYTTSVHLTRLTDNGLREQCKRAEEYVRPKGRTTKIKRKDLVLVAWRTNSNGSYSDICLTAGPEQDRLKRVLASDKKIPLYALDPQHDGE